LAEISKEGAFSDLLHEEMPILMVLGCEMSLFLPAEKEKAPVIAFYTGTKIRRAKTIFGRSTGGSKFVAWKE